METTRRSFISGLTTLFAAPAIVRSGLLMPVKSFLIETPEPLVGYSGALTPQMITLEALRLFNSERLNAPPCIGPALNQSSVNVVLPSIALHGTLDDVSNRYLKPAMTDLANYVGSAPVSGRPLNLPSGVDFAGTEKLAGVAMRMVRAYDMHTDSMPMRFDVRHG